MAWMENEPPAVAIGNGHLLAALEILKQCKAEDFRGGYWGHFQSEDWVRGWTKYTAEFESFAWYWRESRWTQLNWFVTIRVDTLYTSISHSSRSSLRNRGYETINFDGPLREDGTGDYSDFTTDEAIEGCSCAVPQTGNRSKLLQATNSTLKLAWREQPTGDARCLYSGCHIFRPHKYHGNFCPYKCHNFSPHKYR